MGKDLVHLLAYRAEFKRMWNDRWLPAHWEDTAEFWWWLEIEPRDLKAAIEESDQTPPHRVRTSRWALLCVIVQAHYIRRRRREWLQGHSTKTADAA